MGALAKHVGIRRNRVAVLPPEIWALINGSVECHRLDGSVRATVASDIDELMCYDGAHIWGASYGVGKVVKINALTAALIGSYPVSSTHAIGVCFDGAGYIWATNYSTASVDKIRASDGTLIGTYALGHANPWACCYDGHGNVWTTNTGDNTVSKVRVSDGTVLGTYAAGNAAYGICASGDSVWVPNRPGNLIDKVRISDGTVLGSYVPSTHPQDCCFDGECVWVCNDGAANVTRILASDGSVIGNYAVGNHPTGICFDGGNVWVGNTTDHTVMKLALDGTILGTYPTAGAPVGGVMNLVSTKRALPCPATVNPAWTPLAAPPWTARDGAGALYFAGKRWLFGGWSSLGSMNNEVWYDAGAGWVQLADAPWTDRHSASWEIFGGRMVMLGGDCIGGAYKTDVWSTDGVIGGGALTWVRHHNLPAGLDTRALYMSAVLGGRLCLAGGQALPPIAPNIEEFHNDVWSVSNLGIFGDGLPDDWTCDLADAAPGPTRWAPRNGGSVPSSAVLGGRWYICGGGTYDTPGFPVRLYYNDVWWTDDRVNWHLVPTVRPFLAREYQVTIADTVHNRIWILGGFNGDHMRNAAYSDDGGITWTSYIPAWGDRHAASGWFDGTKVYLAAGTGDAGSRSDEWYTP